MIRWFASPIRMAVSATVVAGSLAGGTWALTQWTDFGNDLSRLADDAADDAARTVSVSPLRPTRAVGYTSGYTVEEVAITIQPRDAASVDLSALSITIETPQEQAFLSLASVEEGFAARVEFLRDDNGSGANMTLDEIDLIQLRVPLAVLEFPLQAGEAVSVILDNPGSQPLTIDLAIPTYFESRLVVLDFRAE